MSYLEKLEEALPDKNHPLYRIRKSYALNAIERGKEIAGIIQEFTVIEGKKVLDIGCGEGGTAIAFALCGGHVVATDIYQGQVERTVIRAKENNVNISAAVGDGEAMGFDNNSFDIIILQDVIEHVLHPERVTAEISRVLKPMGCLCLTAPNRISPFIIFREPHSRLFGVSLLPRGLAGKYVVNIRKRTEYSIGHFPTLWYLKRIFKKNNINLFIHFKHISEKIRNPERILSEGKRSFVPLLKKTGMDKILVSLLENRIFRYLFSNFVAPYLIIIGRKEGAADSPLRREMT